MTRTLAALAAGAALALGACSGGSEPTATKTVTESSSSKVDAATADDTAPDEKTDEDTGDGDDLWAQLDTYDDAAALGEAVGDDFWDKSENGFPCTKAEQESASERDPQSGEVADVTWLDCSRKGTMELVTLTVAEDDFTEFGPAVPLCDEGLEFDTCFTGKGWTVDAANTHLLKEVLEGLDIDPEAWGVGDEDMLGDY